MQNNKKITGYSDLDVYQRAYKAGLLVCTKIVPSLPKEEKYDLGDQIKRSSKAPSRLIAEGYAKKHQKKGFHKYIDDAMAEANETVVGLCQCKDIYPNQIDTELCNNLINEYEIIGKQLYRLRESWNKYNSTPNS